MAPGRPPDTVPWRSPTVRVVLAATAVAPLGVPLISPALPLIRDAFGLTDAGASLVVSVYFVAGTAFAPAVGVLADRIGLRQVLVPALFTFGLTGGAVGLASTLGVVLSLRALQGLAAAGIFVTTVAMVGEITESRHNAVLGTNAAVLSGARALYPVLGGGLALSSWRLPFAASLAAIPVALAARRALPDAGRPHSPATPDTRRTLSILIRGEARRLYAAALVSEILLFGALYTAVPFTLAQRFTMSTVEIGLVVGTGAGASALAASLNGRLARVASNEWLVAVSFVCYAVGLTGAWAATSPGQLALAVVPVGAAAGLNLPSVDAALIGLIPAPMRAEGLSLRYGSTFLGRAAGPVLFAWVAGRDLGYPLVLLGGALLSFASFALMAWFTLR